MKLNFFCSALSHTITKVCLIYFGQDCSTWGVLFVVPIRGVLLPYKFWSDSCRISTWKWLSLKLPAEGGTGILEEHPWIASYFVKLQIPSCNLKKSIPAQMCFKDFHERFLEYPWQLLWKYISPCKGENLHSDKSQRPWKGFTSLTILSGSSEASW